MCRGAQDGSDGVTMNPWLERFLIAWAAGIVTTGAVVSTAKKPHKLKKKKKKKKREDGTLEPVQMGATALRDARLPEERGLTMPEWRDKVVAAGARVSSVFKRTPARPAEGVDTSGAKAPDEVQRADGTTVASSSAAKRKRRKGAHAKGRRGKKRREATLWDSAKESFKQTVKESVREEVNETPVGSALETLKSVGAKVKEGATKVGAGAAKAVNRAIEGNPSSDADAPELDAAAPKPPLTEEERARLDAERAKREADRVDVEAGARAAAQVASEVAADLGRKMKGGLSAVGSWLQGPGSPDYGKRRRANPTGEVVDAKVEAPTDAVAAEAPAAQTDGGDDARDSDEEAAQ